jgi:hypothetical protein
MYQNILILPDGSEARIRSLKLREMTNSGTDLTLGSACSDLLEAVIFAEALPLAAGQDITLYKEQDGVRIPVGVYTPEAPTRLGSHTWRITAYDHAAKLDKDLTPWLRSLTGWPYDLQTFAQMVCTTNSKWSWLLRYRMKTKQQNINGYDNIMEYATTHRFRISGSHNSKIWSLHMAADMTIATQQTTSASLGWMLSTRSTWQPSSRFSVAGFAAVFL